MTDLQEAVINDDEAYEEEVYEDSEESVRHPDETGILKLVLLSGQKILELPAEDGVPLETNWHRIEMNLLIDSLHWHWRDRRDYFVGGNMFVYFSLQQVKNKDYRGPDFFVVKGTDGTRDRDSWIVWEEGGRYPDVIVELASPSTVDIDLGLKKDLYEQTFRTGEYFCYDPAAERLFGWELIRGGYAEIKPDSRGRLPSRELGVRLGVWEGEFLNARKLWLRFYTNEGQLVPTKGEAEAQRADAQAQRADAQAQRADAEAQRAEAADQRAEAEAQRAEAEAQRAESADQRAQAAEAEVERMRALLSKQGIP
ncbi:Uma2 family endonuclease [Desulfobacterales bacterium HSG2]|nr:Uma2 family endonuclease [Desulfobacterales bacterium HSG2]